MCCLLLGCTIEASVGAGGARSPDAPPPTEPGASETEGSATTPAHKARVKVNGAKLDPRGDLAFAPDSAAFAGTENEAVLTEIKAYLEQTPRVTRMRIEGHTNNVRPAEQSLQLSGERALAVKTWLLQNGVAESRLLAVGYGDTQPIASNGDPDGQAKNERVAFRIVELDGKPYLGADPLAGGTEFH